MSGYKLSEAGRKRIKTMTETNDGFRIAEVDLELRGPGDIEGLRQSGDMNFKIADLVKDQKILAAARDMADQVLNDDPLLEKPGNQVLQQGLVAYASGRTDWAKIS